jgi:hypothetical protein
VAIEIMDVSEVHEIGSDEAGEREQARDCRLTAIWMRTAFSLVPRNFRIFCVCLIQRKNKSTSTDRIVLVTTVVVDTVRQEDGLAAIQVFDEALHGAAPMLRASYDDLSGTPAFTHRLAAKLRVGDPNSSKLQVWELAGEGYARL